jgi:hypothetical protein
MEEKLGLRRTEIFVKHKDKENFCLKGCTGVKFVKEDKWYGLNISPVNGSKDDCKAQRVLHLKGMDNNRLPELLSLTN